MHRPFLCRYCLTQPAPAAKKSGMPSSPCLDRGTAKRPSKNTNRKHATWNTPRSAPTYPASGLKDLAVFDQSPVRKLRTYLGPFGISRLLSSPGFRRPSSSEVLPLSSSDQMASNYGGWRLTPVPSTDIKDLFHHLWMVECTASHEIGLIVSPSHTHSQL